MAYRNIFSGHGQIMWYACVVFKVYDANRIHRSRNDCLHCLFNRGVETTVIFKSILNASDIFNHYFIPFVIFLCFLIVYVLK